VKRLAAYGEPVEGTPFGRYRLIELLGRGGMGEVWRAHDTAANNRTVAIKLLPAHLAGDNMFVQRFRREADAAAQLNNPHIIPIHQYGEIDGRLYVDMRLVEGRDLQEVLNEGPLEPTRAVRIIEQVAKALRAAHKVGLVHRDVKPSNILIDEDDFAYLIDFGIARGADQTGLTGTGAMIGSWHYMAPERLRAQEADARADIYALACVLYECLTGSQPFPGDSMESQVAAHLTDPPPKPSTTLPTVPTRLDAVIAKGMAKDPDNRYTTTVELADAARDAITVPFPRPAVAPTTPPQPLAAPTTGTDDAPPALTVRKEPGAQTPVATPPGAADHKLSAPEMTNTPPSTDPSVAAPEQADWTNQPPTQLARPSPILSQPPPRTRRLSRRAKIALAVGTVVLVAAAGIVATLAGHQSQQSQSSHTSPTAAHSYGSQVVLPFTGLKSPAGVAVDAAGNVYVADQYNDRVLKLASGANTQTELPFTFPAPPDAYTSFGRERYTPGGVAVDTAGGVYVRDGSYDGKDPTAPWVLRNGRLARVQMLAAGATTAITLPFTDLEGSTGLAVDSAVNVYVTMWGRATVLKLAAGASTPTTLPFPSNPGGSVSSTGLYTPEGVAVDTAGNVYVTDNGKLIGMNTYGGRVWKLVAGASTPTELPFPDHDNAYGVAVDTAGNLYVACGSGNKVLKLAVGASTPTTLPFTGLNLNRAVGVAVDAAGNVYVTDAGNNRVVKLPAG
jgi:serine/threonine protein kinase, bacterial